MHLLSIAYSEVLVLSLACFLCECRLRYMHLHTVATCGLNAMPWDAPHRVDHSDDGSYVQRRVEISIPKYRTVQKWGSDCLAEALCCIYQDLWILGSL